MNQASLDMRFEEAIEYRDLLTSIDTIIEKQTMEVSDNIPRDIFGYFAKDGTISIQVLHMRMGKIIERSGDIFDLVESVDDAVLSYIYQFYDNGSNIMPKEIIIPYLESSQILEELLNIKLTTPVKGIKKQLLDNVMNNAKNNIETLKKMRLIEISKTMTPLEELSKLLKIKYPKTIELFDNSNIQGASAVSAMVKYIDGKPSPKDYRKYKVKTVTGPDDYHTMMEVIERRYKRLLIEKSKFPSLIIVDGGKTQIKACLEVLNKLGIKNDIDVIGLLKDDRHKTRAIMKDNFEEVLVDKKSDLFLLLESMQDEVHRFAITFFKKTHSKNTLTSVLDDIEGLGSRRKKVLLENFETIYDIKNTTQEKLKSLGIPIKVAENRVEGMGYAIPISDAREIITNLMNQKTKTKVPEGKQGALGVQGTDVTEEAAQMYGMPAGFYIADVLKGSAAEKAGITKGCIITKIGGTSVNGGTAVQKELQYYRAGEEVEVTIAVQGNNGDYEEKVVTVKLDKKS